jgi:hypothetical protein
MSPSGNYFTIAEGFTPGQIIRFSIEFGLPADHLHNTMHLECEGRVVRADQVDGKFGVAVEITSSGLDRRAKNVKKANG